MIPGRIVFWDSRRYYQLSLNFASPYPTTSLNIDVIGFQAFFFSMVYITRLLICVGSSPKSSKDGGPLIGKPHRW